VNPSGVAGVRQFSFASLLPKYASIPVSVALVWQSTQGTITPWVVEVDHLGQAQAVAPASPFYQPTDPQIAFHLAGFIEDVRGLPTDAIVLRQVGSGPTTSRPIEARRL
jgi:type IV secretory pathway TrbF-like protein